MAVAKIIFTLSIPNCLGNFKNKSEIKGYPSFPELNHDGKCTVT